MAETGAPEHLERFLRDRGVPGEIVVPGAPTPTVSDAAAALGVPESRIVKSLLFQGSDDEAVLVIARGDRRIDRRKLAQVSGLRQPKLASPDAVLSVTGYRVGGTPPVGHREPVRVVLDAAVMEEPVVYGGGGRDDTMLRISPADIQRLTGAVVADVSLEDA